MKHVRAIIDSARPRQWLKNFLLFVPIVFGGQIFNFWSFASVTVGFIVFCLLSSSNYILNDVIDVEHDRSHPYKRNRPVARRDIPENQALIVAIVFLVLGLVISLFLNFSFFLSACVFVLLHWLLYFVFRTIAVVDVLSIASGYVLRIFAGESAADLHISIWLFLSVLSFSLLLAIGKRRVELSLLQSNRKKNNINQKEALFQYSDKLLDAYIAVFANATFLTYAYFTFLTTPDTIGMFFRSSEQLLSVVGRKWMMLTVPPALYSVMRYLQLVYSVKTGMMEKIVTSDKPLIFAIMIWAVIAFVVVYGIGG
jgi:decaprenyl-phosphate phosphoribosyltransferase